MRKINKIENERVTEVTFHQLTDFSDGKIGGSFNIEYAACGCWLHHCWESSCAANAVPPVSSKPILIFLTSEG